MSVESRLRELARTAREVRGSWGLPFRAIPVGEIIAVLDAEAEPGADTADVDDDARAQLVKLLEANNVYTRTEGGLVDRLAAHEDLVDAIIAAGWRPQTQEN